MRIRIFILQTFIFIMITVIVINLFYFEMTAGYFVTLLIFILLTSLVYQQMKKLKQEKLANEQAEQTENGSSAFFDKNR